MSAFAGWCADWETRSKDAWLRKRRTAAIRMREGAGEGRAPFVYAGSEQFYARKDAGNTRPDRGAGASVAAAVPVPAGAGAGLEAA
eukprot:13417600-Alexandrium_andersonii.AAC.1